MIRKLMMLALAAAFMLATAALAHHSFAATYIVDKEIKIEGKLVPVSASVDDDCPFAARIPGIEMHRINPMALTVTRTPFCIDALPSKALEQTHPDVDAQHPNCTSLVAEDISR